MTIEANIITPNNLKPSDTSKHDNTTDEPNIMEGVETQETFERGEKYAEALLALDPTLEQVHPETDGVVCFDVGSGADLVAAAQLGFTHAVATNNRSAAYQFTFQTSAQREDQTLQAMRQAFPQNVYSSSLSVDDILERVTVLPKLLQERQPRLITMLRMSPGYFDEDAPENFLKRLIGIHEKLQSKCVIILSALDDHPDSDNAFKAVSTILNEKNITHKLIIDSDIPQNLAVLGQRILIIYK